MAFDYQGLLRNIAAGDDDAVVGSVLARRKNGAPSMQLTPGQQAISDISDGVSQVVNPEQVMKSGNVFGTVQGPTVQAPVVAEEPVSQAAMAMPVAYDDKGNVVQSNATVQGIQDEPANADNTATVRPRLVPGVPVTADMANGQRPLSQVDDAAQGAQNAYVNAINAPVVKQSLWKDIGAKLIGGAQAFVQGARGDFQDIKPSEGWGAIKHNNAIRSAASKLAPLQQQQAIDRQAALQNANIDIAAIRPEIMQQEATRKVTQTANLAKWRQDQIDFKNRAQDWKQSDRDAWYKLQNDKLDAIKDNNQDKLDLAQQHQDELERHNGVTEKQTNTKLGNMDTPQAKARRQQITIQAQKDAAIARGKDQQAAQAARERLVKLKAEYNQLGVGNVDQPQQ